jgi:hypothetical protein
MQTAVWESVVGAACFYFPMAITDTSPVAATPQLQVQRRMPGEERLPLAMKTSDFTRESAKECLGREHPAEWSENQIMLELIRRAFLPEPLPERLLLHSW